MIDPTHAFASWFLWIGGVVFLVVYGIPLLVSPLWWARRFLWALPEDAHLTVYLGRCLGAVAIAIVLGCFRAAPEPTRHALVFEVVIAAGALLMAVHAWGAIRRAQPWTETVEIGLYGLVTGLALLAYASL